MDLDHIFLFVRDERTARQMMSSAGLRANYSRVHTGQGTRNLCACLDDMYFELLWLDGSPISPESERIGLGARGRGDGSPLGIAWRGAAPLACDHYAAPFLPDGLTIPVAKASLDLDQPFFFQSPGGRRPVDWPDDLAGLRQRPARARLHHCVLQMPTAKSPPETISEIPMLRVVAGPPGLGAVLTDTYGKPAHRFLWASERAFWK